MLRTNSSHRVIVLKYLIAVFALTVLPKIGMAQTLSAISRQIGPIARAIKPNAPMANVNGVRVYPLNKFDLDIPLAVQREGRYLNNREYIYNSMYDGLVKVRTFNVNDFEKAPQLISKRLTRQGRVGFYVYFDTSLGFFAFVGKRAGQKYARYTFVPKGTSIEIPITVVVDDTAKFPTSAEISAQFTNPHLSVSEYCRTTVFAPTIKQETLTMAQFIKKAKNLEVACDSFISGFYSKGVIANIRATGAR